MKDNSGTPPPAAGVENPALQMTKMVEALINQVERVTGGSHGVRHKKANKRLIAELRQVSSVLSNLASAKPSDPSDIPTPEQLEELAKLLPRTAVPIFPPSLFMPKGEEE